MRTFLLLLAITLFPLSIYADNLALSDREAAERKKAIQQVDYDLDIHLDDQGDSFSGVAVLSFTLANNDKPLRIDFIAGKVQSLAANNNLHPKYTTTEKTIVMPANELKLGKNTIKIAFSHPYSTSSAGVYRFKDPADQKTYIYTQFEPVDASNAFPCFDQPDLKAHFNLALLTPNAWETVSNTPTKSVSNSENGKKLTHFEPSPLMSTYTFAFLAGPYKVWTSQYGAIPLRLMARQSLADNVNPDVWFRLTRFGLDFFARYFNYPYPYKKYDQILVPDLVFGAMENIGAVTFNEKFIEEKQLSYLSTMRMAEVLYHEMAHMWFGNLVTMVWWDDLWLNESFAMFMSIEAMKNTPWIPGVDLYKFYYIKTAAYEADQRLTTHPIIQPLHFAEEAITQFDDITYEKGCSVLQALAYYMGENNFKKGVQTYIARHANSNVTHADFFHYLQEASPQPLKEFIQLWFYQAGVNRVDVTVPVEGDSFALTLQQTGLPLRPHASTFGWYYSDLSGKPQSKTKSKYFYAHNSQQFLQQYRPKPDFVLINSDDQDYVLPVYQPDDMAYIEKNLNNFTKPLARALLWDNLWDQVYRTKIAAPVFIKLIFSGLQKETEPLIIETLRSQALKALAFIPATTPEENAYKATNMEALANLAWGKLTQEKPGSLAQKDWFAFYIQSSQSPAQLGKLLAILQGNQVPEGLQLSQLLRWKIILQLNRFSYPGAAQLIIAEKEKDHSRDANNFSMAAAAIQPLKAQKDVWLTNTLSLSSNKTQSERLAILISMFPIEQNELAEAYSDRIYQDILILNQKKSSEFLLAISSKISPTHCSVKGADALQQFLKTTPKLSLGIKINWLNASEESKYCALNRQLAAQWLKEHTKQGQ